LFATATDTVTDVVNVSMGATDAGYYTPFLGPIWCIQSIVLRMEDGLTVIG